MAKSPTFTANDTTNGTLFLPDFCNIRMVFAIVIIAELLAFLIVLASSSGHQVWDNLSLTSLFIQWVALASTAVLCLCRPWLATLDNRAAAIFSYLLPVIVTALLSGATDWIAYAQMGAGAEQHADFAIRNVTISAIVSAVVMRYFYVQHQLKQNIQAESRARIQDLQGEEMAGIDVAGEAANGKQALFAASELAPDVILLDIRMPVMDGLEAAQHLATLENPPAVIFTTVSVVDYSGW